MKRSVVLTVAAFVLAVLLAGLPGCAPPVEVGKCVVAARVDAVQTAKELRAMHPDPATMPAGVQKALVHFDAEAGLLKPAEAWFRHIEPDKVDPQ